MTREEALKHFESIRPYEADELPQVFATLADDPQFRAVVSTVYPDTPFEAVKTMMLDCKTSLDFQLRFCYSFLEQLLSHAGTGCDADFSALDLRRRYVFVSNHRDIVLDSALLNKLLVDAGCTATCEIAIGDNLLTLPWVKHLVRVNKSFIVERGLSLRETLAASRRLSEYIHYAVEQKHENVWIAQREGRAKDSDDRTQESILKMMCMSGEGSPAERLARLHIVPLAISYEYDPCDFLKARELQQRRDNPAWHKAPGEDVTSMRTGITGYKGRIHYHCAPCIDPLLPELSANTPKTEFFAAVAALIDADIFRNYRLFPSNYAALDMLHGTDEHADHYTADERNRFTAYIEGQLQKIDMPHPDTPFLRHTLLTMYANPAKNSIATRAADAEQHPTAS